MKYRSGVVVLCPQCSRSVATMKCRRGGWLPFLLPFDNVLPIADEVKVEKAQITSCSSGSLNKSCFSFFSGRSGNLTSMSTRSDNEQ